MGYAEHITINKRLWPMKAHYFLWNAGTAPVVPFLSVYAKYHLGFSAFIVGLIYTILPISGMLCRPIAGAIADKLKCQKKMFLTVIVLTAFAFMGILYVPKLPDIDAEVRFSCNDGAADIRKCGRMLDEEVKALPNITVRCRLLCDMSNETVKGINKNWNFTSEIISTGDSRQLTFFDVDIPLYYTDTFKTDCVFFKVNKVLSHDGAIALNPKCPVKISANCTMRCDRREIKSLTKGSVPDDEVYGYSQFWFFLTLMILGWIGQAIIVAVSDTVCFELLGNEPNKYGKQRSFGSLGWGIFSIFAGLLLDTGEGDVKNYEAAFFLSAGVLLLDFMISMFLKVEQKPPSLNIIRDVSRLLKDARIVIFLLWCVFIGMCTGLIWNCLFWLIEDLAGSSEWIKTLEGLAMAIQCLGGELPLFFISGWIMKRLGHVNTMSLILFTIGVRYVLYSVIVDPWYVLPIELLNGVTFALFYACMASYASIVAPPGTATTVQGTVGALFEIGVSLGSLAAGSLWDAVGGSLTFRYFGFASFAIFVVHVIVQKLFQRYRVRGEYTVPQETLPEDYRRELKLVRHY